jgi:hypothetical protein
MDPCFISAQEKTGDYLLEIAAAHRRMRHSSSHSVNNCEACNKAKQARRLSEDEKWIWRPSLTSMFESHKILGLNEGKSPYEATTTHMRVFGYTCFTHVPKEKSNKLDTHKTRRHTVSWICRMEIFYVRSVSFMEMNGYEENTINISKFDEMKQENLEPRNTVQVPESKSIATAQNDRRFWAEAYIEQMVYKLGLTNSKPCHTQSSLEHWQSLKTYANWIIRSVKRLGPECTLCFSPDGI